jgi:hypothetical protein
MLEKDLENYLIQHPELIESELRVLGSQVFCQGKRVDILCEDRFKQRLIIEVKRHATRKDVAQLLDYAGYFIKDGGPPVRVMLAAFRIPQNFRASFDYFGIEYREIRESQLPAGDSGVMDDEQLNVLPTNEPSATMHVPRAIQDHVETLGRESTNATRQGMASKIRRGQMFEQATQAMKILLEADGPVEMSKIVERMRLLGYSSRSYYDLMNALSDAGLVRGEKIGNRNHYTPMVSQ